MAFDTQRNICFACRKLSMSIFKLSTSFVSKTIKLEPKTCYSYQKRKVIAGITQRSGGRTETFDYDTIRAEMKRVVR